MRTAIALLLVPAFACGSRRPDAARYQGIVELHERVMAFEVSGRVRELKVVRGARVQAGQVLAVLDDSMERPQRDQRAAEAAAADAQLDLVRAGTRTEDVRAAEAQVRSARANEETLRDTLERTRKLRADNTVPAAQLEQAQGHYDRAVADRQAAEERLRSLRAGARSQELRAAEARAAQAHAALEQAETRLLRFTLVAPVAGTVLDTHVEPGEVAQPGTPIATLGETRRPYVDVFVPQGELAGIAAGTEATAHVDATADAFRGAVESVGRTTEFTPRYLFSDKERPNLVVRVRVDLDDVATRLHAGVPAFVSFQRSVEAQK